MSNNMKKQKSLKRITLEELMEYAETFWSKLGHLTQFPSKDSYIAYVRDMYLNKISKMNDEEYQLFIDAMAKDNIQRLNGVAKYVESKLHKKS